MSVLRRYQDSAVRWIRPVLLACVALATVAHPVRAQPAPDYLELHRALALLLQSPLARADSTRAPVLTLRGRVEAFEGILLENRPGSPQDSLAVHHLAVLLRQAASGLDMRQSMGIVSDITQDLDLKIGYYRGRLGVAGTSRGLVNVTVRTFRGGRTRMGLTVYCNPYRWANDLRPWESFSRRSSPTSALLLAGYYRCYAADDSGTRRGYRDAAIGLDGRGAVTLDIGISQ